MAVPSIISEDHIVRLQSRRRKLRGDKPPPEIMERRRAQAVFLEVFEKTFSTRAADEACGYDNAFQRWKASDPEFCIRFNQSLSAVQDQLSSHALVRARGYRATAPDGTPLVDGDGTPVYRDGSDRLLMAILGLDEKSDTAEKTVKIEIVSKRLQGNVIEHQP